MRQGAPGGTLNGGTLNNSHPRTPNCPPTPRVQRLSIACQSRVKCDMRTCRALTLISYGRAGDARAPVEKLIYPNYGILVTRPVFEGRLLPRGQG